MFDLVPATEAGCYHGASVLSDCWSQYSFTDCQRHREMVSLVAERSGHSAASPVEVFGFSTGLPDHVQRRAGADQSFLVAVSVMQHGITLRSRWEGFFGQDTGGPLFKRQAGPGHLPSCLTFRGGDQLGEIVDDSRPATGFQEDDRALCLGKRDECVNQPGCLAASLVEETSGNERPAAADMRRESGTESQ